MLNWIRRVSQRITSLEVRGVRSLKDTMKPHDIWKSPEENPINVRLPHAASGNLPANVAPGLRQVKATSLNWLDHCTVGIVDQRFGVVSKNGFLIDELSPNPATNGKHPFLTHRVERARRELRGKTLVLHAIGANTNYYHWMLDCLPRLLLLEEHNIRIEQFENFLVPKKNFQFHLDCLEKAGVPQSKTLELQKGELFHLEEGCFPIFDYFQPRSIKFLRQLFLTDKATERYAKKIYVSRRKTKKRKLKQEDELVQMLTNEFGYDEVFLENYAVAQQAGIFNSATHIIAPHGAGLTNMVFCNEGAHVLEIIPNNYQNLVFWTQSMFIDIQYSMYLTQGDGVNLADPEKDYDINIHRFNKFLITNNF